MSRAWKGGSDRTWRRIRRGVMAANAGENGGRCALNVGAHCPKHERPCPGVCTGMAEEAHHKRGKRYGDDPRHVIAACRACNLHVGDPARFNPQPQPRSRW